MTTSSDRRRLRGAQSLATDTAVSRRWLLGLFGLAAAALMATPARAQSLDDARARGLVGEQLNGYLGVVAAGSGVEGLVTSINAQRRAHYEGIARDNGVPLAAVEQQAGQSLIGRAPAGTVVMNSAGAWVRK